MQIPAGEFKAKCLQLMDKVARTREPGYCHRSLNP